MFSTLLAEPSGMATSAGPVSRAQTILRVLDDARDAGDREGFGGILPTYADALYRTVAEERPSLCVEIGLANGLSTLAILAGLEWAGGRGHLISLDPYQSTLWKNHGVRSVSRAGVQHLHTLREEADFTALPDLLRAGTIVDFAYIDGYHSFEHTFLDFWYLDQMMPVGAVVAFNDCGLKAVHRVIRFIETNRRYHEMDVGLPANYTAHPLGRWKRRWEGRNCADRYFRKREHWQPESSAYYGF